jgi:hypothetical protein
MNVTGTPMRLYSRRRYPQYIGVFLPNFFLKLKLRIDRYSPKV